MKLWAIAFRNAFRLWSISAIRLPGWSVAQSGLRRTRRWLPRDGPCRRRPLARLGDLPHQPDQGAARGFVRDAGERLHQRQVLRVRQQCLRGRAIWSVDTLDTLVQREQGDLQGRRDAEESTGPHAVPALLVLLHLLKRDAKLVGEVGLRHTFGQALDTDVAADQPVDGVWGFRGHKSS